MIRRLRWKITGVTMLVAFMVLLAVFGGVYFFSQANIAQSYIHQLKQAVQTGVVDGRFPCFVAEVLPSGTVRVSGSSYYDLDDEEALLDAVSQALADGGESGVLSQRHLRFYRQDGVLTVRIAFMDSTFEQATLRSLVKVCLLIGLGALLVLLSVLAAFESPTVQACVPQMVSPQNLVQGNAVVSQVSAVTSLVTPFLGSLFYTAFGIGPVFAAAVACFWLTALLECMIHLEYQKPPRTAGIGAIVREELAVSAHFLRREQPDILKLLLLAALAGMFVSGTAVVGFPYLVRTVLGLSATYYGAAESAMGAAAILGSLCAGLLGKKLRVRDLSAIFLSFGLSLFPIGLSFLLPVGRMARYGVRLAG